MKIAPAPDIRKWPTISIVTPSFNQSAYLEECIRSVLSQNYPLTEYVIMDGGSTDGSLKIIEKYAYRLKYWQSEPDEGQFTAIQDGFSHCSGDIMTWINSDDILQPDSLRGVAGIFMARQDVEWITGRPNSMDMVMRNHFVLPTLPLWSRKRYLEGRYHNPFIQQEGTFWRRSLWEKAGARMKTEMQYAGDLELWTRFFRHAALYSVDCLLATFRNHPAQKTATMMERYFHEAEQVLNAEIERHQKERPQVLSWAPIPINKQEIDRYLDRLNLKALNVDPNSKNIESKIDIADSKSQVSKNVGEGETSILLSAVVSTYNAAEFIQGCLEDLINQTIADRMEIIVVDSASEQDEAAVVKDFQSRYPNIKYIRTSIRESVYQAWNRGIKLARGNYITNANTDDRHRWDAFEQMVRVLEADDAIALVYADVVKTGTANETFRDCTPTGFLRWPDWDRRALLEKGCFIGPQPMWRRNVHETYGYFDERYRISADFEFWLRISQTNEFYHIPKTLGLYLDREDSIEHSNSQRKQREDAEIISTYAAAAAPGRIIGAAACESMQDDRSKSKTSNDNKQKTGLPAEGAIPAGKGSIQGEPIMQLKETILKSIQNLIENDQQEAACWVMDKVLLDYPDSPALHSQRAAMAFERQDMDKALHHFENAADLAPQDALIQRQVGDFFYVVEKNAQKALTQYEKVLAIVPDDVETLMLAGHLSMSLHQYRGAQKYYEHVLRVDPGNGEVQQFLDKLHEPQTAAQDNGMSVDQLYASAQDNARNGDRQAAIQLLEQVLAKDPEHPQGHNDLGVLYYEAGDMEKAQAHYERASGLQPENEIFQKNLADFYWVALADPQKAMQQYVQVLKLNPQDVESLLGCVQICMVLNKTGDARDLLEVALSIEPWNENVLQLREQLENGTTAAGPVKNANDLYEQAKQKAASGDLEGAIHDLTQVLVHSPDESKYHNELGILYYETGRKEKALASYEQAVRLDPSEHNYAKNLADYYLIEQGRAEDAMKLYLQVLEHNPEDIEALMATGLVCISIGHAQDAKHFYGRVLELDPWNQAARDAIENIHNQVDQEEKQVAGKTATG